MAWTKSPAIPLRSGHEDVEDAAARLMSDNESDEPVLAPSTTSRPALSFRDLSLAGLLLLTSNLFWALVCVVLWQTSSSCRAEQRLLHKTNFIAKPALHLSSKVIQFDDLLTYNTTSKSIYRKLDPRLPSYFGPPSLDIDAAWKELLWPEYPAISPKEMKWNRHLSFDEKDRLPATGQFHVALNVFHDLHCLNAVRKELDKEYYGEQHHHGSVGHRDGSPVMAANQRDHIDHCMNQIRQALQCRPDLSPAAMHIYTDTDGESFWVGNAKKHSCYNWNELMDWAQERRHGAYGFWEDHDA